jgi:hypothetical protein
MFVLLQSYKLHGLNSSFISCAGQTLNNVRTEPTSTMQTNVHTHTTIQMHAEIHRLVLITIFNFKKLMRNYFKMQLSTYID